MLYHTNNFKIICELLAFKQAVGCKDIDPPNYTWMKRDGDISTIGCENSQHTWELRCLGSKWIGGLGNCTEPIGESNNNEQIITLCETECQHIT